MKVNTRFSFFLLGFPCFLPFIWRLSHLSGWPESIGLLSDLGCGLLLFAVTLAVPMLLRLPLLLFWVLFQAGSRELYAAIHRLPSWSDLQYLTDPEFVSNSVSGVHLAYPFFAALLIISLLLTLFLRAPRLRPRLPMVGAIAAACLLAAQIPLSHRHEDVSVASRYNPLHWFVRDVVVGLLMEPPAHLKVADLPQDLRRADLSGTTLLKHPRGKNVLIVVMEGLPGLYYPEIRQAMGVKEKAFTMQGLADSTTKGMLVPDFATHSHQTIRGLYAMLCGDFSKFSYETPKAFELQQDLARAGDCLPARMAAAGWSTHFLQAANLSFMSKDRVMPMIGFQEVHGSEWFTEPDPDASMWGPSDPAYFRQVMTYIEDLRRNEKKPWMLTLLTVGTHHPFQVSDEVAKLYPDRRTATVAILDRAVADFVKRLAAEKVLDDTLVILTSDESHGSELAEWMSSWGMCIVLAPNGEQLPRLKTGTYGMVDMTPSILDYFGLDLPPTMVGRSIFRDYQTPREMVSYTGGKLRWYGGDNISYECSREGSCLKERASSILGRPAEIIGSDTPEHTSRLWSLAAAMDHSLDEGQKSRTLQFAGGEVRKLPEKLVNEWADNLAGAQYLEFPAGSRVHVLIRVMAMQASAAGLQLQLTLREHEQLVSDIPYKAFPVLHSGEEGKVEFDFFNAKARQAFSFHLVGEGKGGVVKLEEFNVTVEEKSS